MKNGVERRRHIRAPLALKTVLQTSHGDIEGKTADISISGLAVILFLENPEIEDEFQITIQLPDGIEISVICEKIWAAKMISDETVYNAIGAEFIKLSSDDRKALVAMIVEYYRE